MKDFSLWNEYEGVSEGSGRSEKIWLINPDTEKIGLFKFKKDIMTTDHVSECIAYRVASLLNIPCAKFELGVYNGREGSISYNIIQNTDEILIEGINFIHNVYPQYAPDRLVDMNSGDVYSIEMIEKVMDGVLSIKDFLHIPVFDYLIGNSDRHQSNWAVLQSQQQVVFSPLYDNSSSLCASLSDEQAKSYLGRDVLRWKSLVVSKSRSLIRRTLRDDKKPTQLEMMEFLRDNYAKDIKQLVEKTIAVMTLENIRDILHQYEKELGENKKLVIEKFLLSKVQDLEGLFLEKEK